MRVALMLAMTVMAACDPCTNDLYGRVSAPNGKLEAIVFERNCGAASPFSHQVSVGSPGHAARGQGNIAQFVPANSSAVWTPGQEAVTVMWKDNESLHIAYYPALKPTWEVARWGNLSITYEAKESPAGN